MMGQLVPCGGGDPIPLLKPRLVVGRRSNCDIILTFSNVSSQHCLLEMINGYWHIKDLGSTNGVKINGQRYDAKFLLPGDELAIAKHRYQISYEPVADAPPPVVDQNPFEMSLLEKAGLENRRRREALDRVRSAPAPAKAPPTNKRFSADEDSAVQWLLGDDE